MAEYSTSASFIAAEALTENEIDWLTAVMNLNIDELTEEQREARGYEDSCFDPSPLMEIIVVPELGKKGTYLRVGAQMHFSVEDTCRFLQFWLKEMRPIGSIGFEFAFTCSHLMPDGFGGGFAFVTASRVEIETTHEWLVEREKEWAEENTE